MKKTEISSIITEETVLNVIKNTQDDNWNDTLNLGRIFHDTSRSDGG